MINDPQRMKGNLPETRDDVGWGQSMDFGGDEVSPGVGVEGCFL